MKRFFSIILRTVLALNIAGITWLVSYLGFEQAFINSVGFSVVTGLLIYWTSSVLLQFRFLKKHRLTWTEYRYINNNLQEARSKLFRLHKALMSFRHIPSIKKRMELVKITRKIYSLTKEEPRRFYKAERFYFSHLDSAVELSEKYIFLTGQPKKNKEMDRALYDTRKALEELADFIEKDLYDLISDEIGQLHLELDVAKHAKNKMKSPEIHDESGNKV